MRHGFIGMTQKRRCSRHSGDIRHFRAKKKSIAGPQQCQGHVDLFLWFPWSEHAPQGQTITKEYYQEVPRHLCDTVRRKRPDLWPAKSWQLHHDNAPAYSVHVIQAFFAKHNIPVVCQAPCNFWPFPKLKITLKGTRFESKEDVMQNATNQLNTIPITVFQECFQKWQKRWGKCVYHQGDYFEGDLTCQCTGWVCETHVQVFL